MRELSQSEGKETSGPADARYRRYFEGFPDMLFTAAADGRLMEVNQAGVEIFRYADRNDMCGIDSMASLFRDVEGWQCFLGRIETQGFVKDVVMEMQRRDGSCFLACISANLRTRTDKTIVCDGLLRDMSGHWELQRALKESEQPIQEIREHFLHTLMILSHDLRGPLVSMVAGLKLLARGRFGSMDESVVIKVKGLLRQAIRLNGIAEDCLARAAAIDGFGEIQRDPLDLRKDIIDPIIEELADEILSGRVMIGLEAVPAGAVTVHAANRWLKSVYRNLLKNAAQYGGKGCTIVFGYEDHGRYHRLNVYNSGEPVREELRDRLFTKFGHIGSIAENATGGIGLGLYLVREIIRKHGGEIWYEACRTGSNFLFTIPKEKQQ